MRSRTGCGQFDTLICETTRPSKAPLMPTKARLMDNACASTSRGREWHECGAERADVECGHHRCIQECRGRSRRLANLCCEPASEVPSFPWTHRR